MTRDGSGSQGPIDYAPTLNDTSGFTDPDANPVVRPGSLIARYRLGDVLGRGGMGEVVSARDEQIGRSVAIKRLRTAQPSEEVVARFLREARIQGRLEHPAVVPVHELWYDDGGQPFFVMKQLTGTTLADVLPRLAARDAAALEKYPRQRLLRAFAEACLAIEFAHTRGVVHRDLKPANIMLGDFGEVYVLDWGIARIAGEDAGRGSFADIDTADGTQTMAGAILGTPGYIPPEQIRGQPDVDGRTDVYALGCILFEILTLQPLHPRGQPGIASAIAGIDARASVRTPDRDIPPELDAICVRATAVERADRYPTARELGDAVQRYLDGNRDVTLRRQLARAELDEARAALAKESTSSGRRAALRAAARAIALDPLDREAVDLVGRLMLEPPKDMPVEVSDELERIDMAALQSSAKLGMFAALMLVVFLPVLYWSGFRETWYHVTGVVVCAVIAVANTVFGPRNPKLASYIAVPGFLAMFGLLSWMISPVIIGPGPAVLLLILTITAHRKLFRPWLLAIFTWIATLAPWLLDAADIIAPRASVAGSDIVLHTAADHLAPETTIVGLGFYIAALIHVAVFLTRLQDDERRRQRAKLQMQSWQLGQLVPRASSLPATD